MNLRDDGCFSCTREELLILVELAEIGYRAHLRDGGELDPALERVIYDAKLCLGLIGGSRKIPRKIPHFDGGFIVLPGGGRVERRSEKWRRRRKNILGDDA